MRLRCASLLALVVALAACGDDGGSDDVGTDCEEVTAALLAAIASGEESGVGMEAVAGSAWRSPDFEQVWFVAMEFSATGVDNQTGVWATNSLDPGEGLILAVDGFANEFTVWPDASSTDAAISPADRGVDEAKSCLHG